MIPAIQNSFISGELSPSFLGRTDKPQYRNGASTMRNCFVRYQGGASSRAGFAYCGMCKQAAPNAGGTATSNPPRLINFQFNINQGFALEFGDQYMRILSAGAYVTEAGKTVTGITQANPGMITIASHGYSNGDWVFGSGIGGMNNFNGLTWIVQNVTTNTFTLTDLFGNAVNTTNFFSFTSGGTFARIYTVVSPYAAIDLPYLKFTENANTMNLTCWNQATNAAYAPYTLQRLANTNWVFTAVSFSVPISAPSSVKATANNSTTASTWYSYQVTAVDNQGNESVASTAADVFNNDIAVNAGSNIITWTSSGSNVSNYNIYAATPVFVLTPFADPGFTGVPYGLIGSAFGLQFTDTNIIPDFTRSPPTHNNPFAPGTILDVTATAGGTNWTTAGTGFVISTSTGTGAILVPIVQNTQVTGGIVLFGGQGYAATDTASVSGVGSLATISLSIGPQSGTYPGAVQYYQQRLVYANTINQPDTYFMSQPGLYNNFDSAIPTVDSDAIIGTPWAVQINGIQFMIPSIQGLLTFTGNGVWLINGGNSVALTPADQNAQAQSQVGCSAIVQPLFINLHLLYVQAKNSIVRDIAFNFLTNVFTGTDITVFSNHLFLGYTLSQWAYSEEPFKTIWAIRNDGIMLSLCYVKEQEIQGWARHDTNGLFISVCSVIEPPINEDVSYTVEPPIDAIYTITQRYIPGTASVPAGKWVYYSERANNRIWQNIEDCFCVDAGLFYPLTYPKATLTPAEDEGTNNISSTNLITGGTGYTNPTATAFDSTGAGSGATFSVTQTSGILNAPVLITQGQNYTPGATSIIISDPTGSGAVVDPIITNNVLFTSTAAAFNQIQYIYVTNSIDGTVSVINPLTNLVVTTIIAGSAPGALAVTPDGSQVWVVNSGSKNISVISTASLAVIATIPVGTSPRFIAFTPNGTKAYITDGGVTGLVWPINVITRTVGSSIPVGRIPKGIYVLPNGITAYSVNSNTNSLTPITVATNTPLPIISGIGFSPEQIVATPDSSTLYVTTMDFTNNVYIIDTASGTITTTLTAGAGANGLSITPNGSFVYVTNGADGTVSVISTASNTITATININNGGVPSYPCATPDGKFIYVPNGNNTNNRTITIISTLTNTIVGAVSAGLSPTQAACSPTVTASIGTIGDVIRVDGGKATITQYISSTQVMADITQPLTLTVPNDPNEMPIPAIAGTWSIARPIMTVSGLNHLEGMTVTGLADGGVIVPQTVTNGQITLQEPASAINVGLGFVAQTQSMYLDAQEQTTMQGRRKDIQAVTVRLEASRGVQVGTNQPDASAQPNQVTVPWTNMKEIKERNNLITAGTALPLFTGDHRINVPGDWKSNGQVAIQQMYPLPLNLLALVINYTSGDNPS